MTMNNQPQSGELVCAAPDLGSGFSTVSIMKDGRLHSLKFDLDGDEVPSVIWKDDDGTTYVGKEALNRAYKNPNNLYMHFKPELFDKPDEPVNGGMTRVELTAELIRFITVQLLKRFPEFAEYPQFGGNTRSANNLVLAFSIPAAWGIEQQATMRRAIQAAGIKIDVGKIAFPSEPKAAARRMAHEHGRRLKNRMLILVIDVGDGTIDIIVVRYENGVFHEVTAPMGDNFLGGRLFTAGLAIEICTAMKAKCAAAFSIEKGLQLGNLKDASERELATEIWQNAERGKLALSTRDQVSVFVQTPKGKREVVLTQEQAQKAWAPLWKRMESTLKEKMLAAGISFEQIDEILLVGGGSETAGCQDHVATWTGRHPSDILMSANSSHVVADGAAEEAYFGEKTDQVAVDPFGIRMLDEQRNYVNRVLTRPGQVIPAAGLQIEHYGQAIRSPGGATKLLLEPFIGKPGVRCGDPSLGLQVTLSDQEIIPLKRLQPSIELPAGLHDVRLSMEIDPLRSMRIVFTALNLPHIEPISVPLEMAEAGTDEELIRLGALAFLPIIDASGSMEGKKIKDAKASLRKFLDQMTRYQPQIGLVRMNDDVQLVCPLTTDVAQCRQRLNEIKAGGGTLMTESLELADRTLRGLDSTFSKFVVLVSDGLPQCPSTAVEQAKKLKDVATVFCVGIGHDASEVLLKQIASSESHYYFAELPEDLFAIFNKIAEIIHRSYGQND